MTITNLSEKWACSGSRNPVKFRALGANSFKTAEDKNFKFDSRVIGIVPT